MSAAKGSSSCKGSRIHWRKHRRNCVAFTYLLHPPFLEANGLEGTVRHYVEGFSKRTGVKARLRIGWGIDTLPAVLHRPLFRVIQEALANVYRHASASRVSIDMRCMLGHLHLVVQDNGRGMGGMKRPGQRQSEPSCLGVGIPSIRARLRQFGGRLVIKSGPPSRHRAACDRSDHCRSHPRHGRSAEHREFLSGFRGFCGCEEKDAPVEASR